MILFQLACACLAVAHQAPLLCSSHCVHIAAGKIHRCCSMIVAVVAVRLSTNLIEGFCLNSARLPSARRAQLDKRARRDKEPAAHRRGTKVLALVCSMVETAKEEGRVSPRRDELSPSSSEGLNGEINERGDWCRPAARTGRG